MRFLAVLLLALGLVCATQGAVTPMFQQIARFDCDGTFEVVPSSIMGTSLRAPMLRNMINTGLGILYSRVQCACPGVTKADFNRHFGFDAVLNGFQTQKTAPNDCINNNFPRNIYETDLFKITMPNTCSYSQWTTAGTCGFQIALPRVDMTLQVGFASCTNSFVPSVSLTCSGTGCANALKPCTSNSDCGGVLTCFDATHYVGTDLSGMFFQGLESINVYDNTTDTTPGCYQATRGNGAPTPANDIFTNLFSFFASEAYGLTATYSQLKVCGILEFVDFTSGHLFLNQSALADLNYTTQVTTGFDSSCIANLTAQNPAQGSVFNGMTSTSRLAISVPALTAWNGIDAGGNNVFTVNNIIPAPQPISDNNLLLGMLTCDQNLVLPAHSAGIIFNKEVSDLLQHFASLLQAITACRTNPATTDYRVFLARFGVWNWEFFSRLFDPSSATFSVPAGKDFTTFFSHSTLTLHNLPATCNWNTWINKGICQIDFAGLSSLLQADITLRFTAQTCSNNNLFSSYAFECVGADCAFFQGLNPCDDNNACTKGMPCQTIASYVQQISTDINLNFNMTYYNDIINTDFIDLIFNPAYNHDLCSAPTWGMTHLNNTNNLPNFGHYPTTTCAGPTQFQSDIQTFLMGVFGKPNANTMAQSKLKFCLPNTANFALSSLQTWAQNLVTVSGSQVSLSATAFVATPAGSTLPGGGTGGNNNSPTPSPSANSNGMMLAPSALFAVVLAFVAFFFKY